MASVTAAVRQSITENAQWAHGHAQTRGCCTTVRNNKLNDDFIYQRLPIRVIGAIMIVFSIIEFGVGGFCYGFLVSEHMIGAGAFWAGLMYFILGCLCVWMRTKAVCMGALCMAVVSWVVGLAGVGLDGSVATNVNNSLACSQLITGRGFGPKYTDYGFQQAYTAADACFFQAYPAISNTMCYCSDTVLPTNDINGSPKCYNMQLGPAANDCSEVFSRYGPALQASAGLCGFLLFLSFFEIILLSYALCCERRPEEARSEDDKSEAVVSNPAAAGAVAAASASTAAAAATTSVEDQA